MENTPLEDIGITDRRVRFLKLVGKVVEQSETSVSVEDIKVKVVKSSVIVERWQADLRRRHEKEVSDVAVRTYLYRQVKLGLVAQPAGGLFSLTPKGREAVERFQFQGG